MTMLKIRIENSQGETNCQVQGEGQAVMVYEGEYQPGDTIVFEAGKTDAYYVIRVDDGMDEAYVYLTKEKSCILFPLMRKKFPTALNALLGTGTISPCGRRGSMKTKDTGTWPRM